MVDDNQRWHRTGRGHAANLRILLGQPKPAGWSGKLLAVSKASLPARGR